QLGVVLLALALCIRELSYHAGIPGVDETSEREVSLQALTGDYLSTISAVHRNRSHSITSLPVAFPVRSIRIVNASIGSSTASAMSGALATSSAAAYLVPHCPVSRLTINVGPPRVSFVQSVYRPGSSRIPASEIGALVLNCVASF